MIRRRDLTRIVPPLLGASLVAPAVLAQGRFPERPIRLIAPFPPGGPIDAGARIIGPALSAQLGQPVVVENRSGAGGSVGVAEAARAAPDGHTLVFSTAGSLAVNVSLIPNLS
ncbi:MAG: tripartite tricarboxylate transporter substrate binding protein, partial [Acetobacteraceae bacterium]|nr:tripartite tricarboxylate transporter substrate binding protein [Acetobacteraceae bacterium]